MNKKPTLTQHELVAGLYALGITPGSKLLVHSSLSSFGYVEGGADAVIDAFLDVIGVQGTLLVPTLTGDETLSATNPPVFDPVAQACWTGVIPETLRKRAQAVRSLHPTHSVAALGADALALTRDHLSSVTPCDELSPYGKLARYDDAYIVLVGVTHQSSTLFHHVEELAGAEYHMQAGFVQATIVLGGNRITRHLMLHRYGTPLNFAVMEPLFLAEGIQRQTTIGNAEIRLVHVAGMVRTTVRAMAADKRILCAGQRGGPRQQAEVNDRPAR